MPNAPHAQRVQLQGIAPSRPPPQRRRHSESFTHWKFAALCVHAKHATAFLNSHRTLDSMPASSIYGCPVALGHRTHTHGPLNIPSPCCWSFSAWCSRTAGLRPKSASLCAARESSPILSSVLHLPFGPRAAHKFHHRHPAHHQRIQRASLANSFLSDRLWPIIFRLPFRATAHPSRDTRRLYSEISPSRRCPHIPLQYLYIMRPSLYRLPYTTYRTIYPSLYTAMSSRALSGAQTIDVVDAEPTVLSHPTRSTLSAPLPDFAALLPWTYATHMRTTQYVSNRS